MSQERVHNSLSVILHPFCSGLHTDDVLGALTQGATLEEARENLIDAVRMIRESVDLSKLPKNKIVIEQIEA
jgi:predicted RNase H-like HicB family nuclease